jgi:hypothetical protein
MLNMDCKLQEVTFCRCGFLELLLAGLELLLDSSHSHINIFLRVV